MKTDRQRLILKIVATNKVHNQDELQKLLEGKGVAVTQATLSRDVNELELVKYRADDGTLCYRKRMMGSGSAPSCPTDGVVSIEFLGQLAVMKTHPGFASVMASAMDRCSLTEIAGTIAGDDTIFVALRQPADTDIVLDSLETIFPGIQSKLI